MIRRLLLVLDNLEHLPEAALWLGARAQLGRETFARGAPDGAAARCGHAQIHGAALRL